MSDSGYRYIGELLTINEGESSFLEEILTLAKEGLHEHVGVILSGCETPSALAATALATATHRLTNVVTALGLNHLARELNEMESAARADDRDRFCALWSELSPTIQTVTGEVERALQR